MNLVTPQPQASSATHAIETLAHAEGSIGHSFLQDREVFMGRHNARNLADVMHHICLLHGRQPGVIDHASARTVEGPARTWMVQASEGFAQERMLLTRLVVAAGPLPSTPGQAETESAVIAQHHALDMLAQSDRRGCALGAAAALVIDWHAIRPIINRAAERFGVEASACTLPNTEETAAMVNAVCDSPAIERALTFGAQQLLGQHRGLWDLLEARTVARGDW